MPDIRYNPFVMGRSQFFPQHTAGPLLERVANVSPWAAAFLNEYLPGRVDDPTLGMMPVGMPRIGKLNFTQQGAQRMKPLNPTAASPSWSWLSPHRTHAIEVTEYGGHPRTAERVLQRGGETAYSRMLENGWIRKNGLEYEVGEASPDALKAIEDDILADRFFRAEGTPIYVDVGGESLRATREDVIQYGLAKAIQLTKMRGFLP